MGLFSMILNNIKCVYRTPVWQMLMCYCVRMCVRLTQHAHPQHEGIHGVGQTPGSPSCTWWEHHLLGLGLLTFYLCRQTNTHICTCAHKHTHRDKPLDCVRYTTRQI